MSRRFETNPDNNFANVLKKAVWIILVALVLIVICLATALKIYSGRKTLITRSVSGDGLHSVSVYMIGDPDFPYGRAHCTLILTAEQGKKDLGRVKVDVANDGGPRVEENFSFTWRDDHVDILVTGDEMDPKMVSMNY